MRKRSTIYMEEDVFGGMKTAAWKKQTSVSRMIERLCQGYLSGTAKPAAEVGLQPKKPGEVTTHFFNPVLKKKGI